MKKRLAKEILKTSHFVQRGLSASFHSDELSPHHGRLLGFLSRNPKASSMEIQQHFGLSKSTVSELLKSLVNKGYITYDRGTGDARYRDIVITDKGRSTIQESECTLNEYEEKIREGLSDEEVSQMLALLEKVQDNIGGLLKNEQRKEEKE